MPHCPETVAAISRGPCDGKHLLLTRIPPGLAALGRQPKGPGPRAWLICVRVPRRVLLRQWLARRRQEQAKWDGLLLRGKADGQPDATGLHTRGVLMYVPSLYVIERPHDSTTRVDRRTFLNAATSGRCTGQRHAVATAVVAASPRLAIGCELLQISRSDLPSSSQDLPQFSQRGLSAHHSTQSVFPSEVRCCLPLRRVCEQVPLASCEMSRETKVASVGPPRLTTLLQ